MGGGFFITHRFLFRLTYTNRWRTNLCEPSCCNGSPVRSATLGFSFVVNLTTTSTSLSPPRFVSFKYEPWRKTSYLNSEGQLGLKGLSNRQMGLLESRPSLVLAPL